MSGGVKNLRAMFESSNDSTSPPDRGRSPAQSFGPGSNGSSPQPRPLSKVRTSFVTVEKSGQLGNQLGLRRDKSGEPSMAMRRPSFSIDEEDNPKATADRKKSIAVEIDARKDSAVAEIIPEIAIETEDADKVPDQSARKLRGREPTRPQPEEKKSLPSNKETAKTQNGVPKTTAAAVKVPEKEITIRTTPRPAPISTIKSNSAAKVSPKTTKAPLPKTPTTPKTQTGPKIEKRIEKQTSRASLAPKQPLNPSSKPTTSTSQNPAPKTRIGASPPQTGFVKPKPRSPTRPVKLPASLTAHTASSGSKTAAAVAPQIPAPRQSLSRASGHSQPAKPLQASQTVSRSPSRASTTTSKSTLTRKPSTLNKTSTNRPSLGPPPAQIKKKPSRQSLPAPADEGFLARMMRSTASSASKTNDKVPTTPPKKPQPTRRSPPKHEAREPLRTESPKPEKQETATGAHSKLKVTAKDQIAPKPAATTSVKGSPKKSRSDDVSKTETDVVVPAAAENEIKEQPATTLSTASPDDGAPDSVASPVNIADVSSTTGEVASEPEQPKAAELITSKNEDTAEAETIKEDAEKPEVKLETNGISLAKSEEADDAVAKKPVVEVESPAQVEAVGPEEDDKLAIPVSDPSEAHSKDALAIPDSTPVKEDKPKEEENEVVAAPEDVKSEQPAEDPEDVRAREEIAQMNAELRKDSEAKSTEVAA